MSHASEATTTQLEKGTEMLEQLNTRSFQPKRKLLISNMVINKKYRILSAQRCLKLNNSKKEVIRLDFGKNFIYLPQRFIEIPECIIKELNSCQDIEICNIGKWRKTSNLVFKKTSASDTNGTQTFNVADYLTSFNPPNFYVEQ